MNFVHEFQVRTNFEDVLKWGAFVVFVRKWASFSWMYNIRYHSLPKSTLS